MKYLILMFLSFSAFAHGDTTNNYYPTETVVKGKTPGVATAISASQLNFDWGSYALQGSVGYGNYDNENALTFGLGKRFGRVLINGSVGSESNTDNYSIGAGISWKF